MADPGERLDYGIAPPGHRLPAELRLGPVRLQVADLERSLGFYEQVLGLRVLRKGAAKVALGVPKSAEPLVELHERRGANPVPRGGRVGLYHFAILLPDRAALGRFVAHLAELGVRAGSADHRVSEALYLNDPDGMGIEIYADRPRAEWAHRDRELVMTTDPLDLRAVMAAGAGARWDGMPAGTTMGHVHLHVADLGSASSFYHEALGFDRVVWSYPGALFLSAGGYHHHLGVNEWAAGAAPAGEGDARLIEWEIVLREPGEVEAAVRSLEAGGHAVERDATGVRARDPWGTAVRLRT